MANFDEIKDKVKHVAGVIADVAVEGYKIAEEKSRVLARATKLSAENAVDKSTIKKLYAEIGKLYYAVYANTPDEDFAQSVAEITAAKERIVARLAEIESIKTAGASGGAADEDAFDDAETEPLDDEDEESNDIETPSDETE
jgi:hypothetical protein